MGYFSLDIKKAKGTSDTTQSDHIERKIIPKNADPTRTHLNRVLVEYPDGVHGRDEAIAHRLNTAGIRRKITHDQVRVRSGGLVGYARGHDEHTGKRRTR